MIAIFKHTEDPEVPYPPGAVIDIRGKSLCAADLIELAEAIRKAEENRIDWNILHDNPIKLPPIELLPFTRRMQLAWYGIY